MDPVNLLSFLVLPEVRHVGRAAGRLSMSTSGRARQINALECARGVPLVTRTTRRVQLTEAGPALAAKSCRLLQAMDDLERSPASPQPWLVARCFVSLGLPAARSRPRSRFSKRGFEGHVLALAKSPSTTR